MTFEELLDQAIAMLQRLDPVLERMMAAVHRYEGTVNQVIVIPNDLHMDYSAIGQTTRRSGDPKRSISSRSSHDIV